jgi:phage gpG-like protein
MSVVEVKVDSKNAERVLDNVIRVAGGQEGSRAAAKVLEQRVRQTFRDEADPWGNPWPPHSPVTLDRREKRGNASIQMLIDSGAMFDSLHTEEGTEGFDVVMGGPGMWPGVHQNGNPSNRMFGKASAPIPARPMFPIRNDVPELPGEWAQAILAPLETLMQEAIA